MSQVAVLWLAFAVDRWFGEPPTRWHPVVAMGRYLSWAGTMTAPRTGEPPRRAFEFVCGTLAWVAGAAIAVALAGSLQALLSQLPLALYVLLASLLLKPMFAWRMLREQTEAVEQELGTSLEAGREQLASVVSRDVAELTEVEVRESAIESLAENLNDSVVAPLFWFAVLGLPGAVLYRFANTADAMWGYRADRAGRQWEWAGKFAARADDVLSWIPARLTSAVICVAHGSGAAFRELRQEAGRTVSPNGGWPMAAMALALGVRLGKPGHYVLNPSGRSSVPADSVRAGELAARAVLWCLALATFTAFARQAL